MSNVVHISEIAGEGDADGYRPACLYVYSRRIGDEETRWWGRAQTGEGVSYTRTDVHTQMVEMLMNSYVPKEDREHALAKLKAIRKGEKWQDS